MHYMIIAIMMAVIAVIGMMLQRVSRARRCTTG